MSSTVDLAELARASVPEPFLDRLRGARNVVAVTHEHPDADTIGAVLGICLLVEALGGRATAVSTDAIPPLYGFLPGLDRFRTDPDPAEAYDLLVLADCATAARVGDVANRNAALFASLPRAIVDHHASNDAAGDADWIDPRAAATCELVTLLAVRLGVPLDLGDRTLADALMAGIVMDTATFAHPNATPRTLAVSAALVEAGAPLSDISRRLYRSKPDVQLRLFGRVLDRLETSADRRVIWSTLRNADLAETDAIPAHSEGIIDLLAQSEAAEVSMLLKEQEDGTTRLSVRTKPGGVDATVLTGTWGGGGHARAAGATILLPLGEAVPVVRSVAEQLAAQVRRVSPRDRRGGLDGVLVVAKPSGPTSHDVVGLVRRLSSTRRVGHGGTLDPFAAGVLPVFLGRATRLVEYHLSGVKRYRATICFGETSTTDDIDGERTTVEGPALTRAAVEAALDAFRGPIRQVPPDYSAVQIEGRRAYAMARRGETVDLPARDVVIHEATLLEWDDSDPARPVAVVDVECSAGTYIRALARDLGASLGSGAYLGALVRTASGGFRLEDAISFEALREHAADGPAGIERVLRPIDAGLEDLPHAVVTNDEVRRLGEGLITAPKTPLVLRDAPLVLAVGQDGRVVAVCKAVTGALHPHKVLAERPAESGRPVRREAAGPAAETPEAGAAPEPGTDPSDPGTPAGEPG